MFSSVVAGIFAVLIGEGATLIPNYKTSPDKWAAFVPMLLFLLCSLVYAVMASRPIRFRTSGNNPKHWVSDITSGSSLHGSKAEMIAHYVDAIEKNHEAMRINAKLLSYALRSLIVAMICGFLALVAMQ